MAVNLRNFNKPKHAQTLLSSVGFQNKNKIVVNNPVQSHFTVEGVQSYTPKQIQAMKVREDRLMETKEGKYAPVQTITLSEKLVDDDILKEEKGKVTTEKKKERPKSKKEFKTNLRNAVSMNNQNIVKIEKERAKKDALQRKLQKMSTKYKEYFKDVDMKQGLTSNKKIQEEDISEYEASVEEIQRNTKIQNTTQGQTKLHKNKEEEEQSISSDSEKNEGLNLGFNLIRNCTSYSQKLGTAIDGLFK